MQDVDTVDLVNLFDAMLEFKHRRAIDCNLEFTHRAEDLHLEMMSWKKWKGSKEVPLFYPPFFSQLVVTDQDLLSSVVKAWVDVQGDVITSQEIYSEHFSIRLNLPSYCEHQLVVDSSGEVHVEGH